MRNTFFCWDVGNSVVVEIKAMLVRSRVGGDWRVNPDLTATDCQINSTPGPGISANGITHAETAKG
ncbi:MAG: hypothetical protein COB30_008345 [Ectothiorhodospiraceae bacterium]|nr:hypothetical protein [Ectothiorhodospiraceae bacterium]